MKRNFKVSYSRSHRKPTDVTDNLPGDCRYPLRYARAELYNWDDGSRLINQYYKSFLFYMEMFQYKLKSELEGQFNIKQPCLFLFLMLDGTIHFYTSDGRSVYDARKGMCYATSNNTGDFCFTLPKGGHLFFYLQPRGDYLKNYPDSYPDLAELLESLEKDQKQYKNMPDCLIEGEILDALLKLYKLSEGKGYDLEAEFIKYCRQLLMAYHKMVRLRLEKPVYRVKDFIATSYTDHQITAISALATRFNMSVRALERNYLHEFDASPQQYIIQLRMEKAKTLLVNENMSIVEAATATGYTGITSFRKAFRNYFGYPPGRANE